MFKKNKKNKNIYSEPIMKIAFVAERYSRALDALDDFANENHNIIQKRYKNKVILKDGTEIIALSPTDYIYIKGNRFQQIIWVDLVDSLTAEEICSRLTDDVDDEYKNLYYRW